MIEIDVSKQLLQELQIATKKILDSKKLRDSDLGKSLEWKYDNNIFTLLALDYFEYVSTGRRPRARKVPVLDIIKWMKEKNIVPRNGSYNQVAFAITEHIYKNGIKARNYMNPVLELSTDIISANLAETLSEAIAEEIANDLTMTI